MTLKHTSLAIALTCLLASAADAQKPSPPPAPPPAQADRGTPVFKVQVWGDIVADFNARLRSFDDLRREMEKGLPPLRVTDDPAETRMAIAAEPEKIRAARAKAKQGDVFTPAISAEFKKALTLAMNSSTWAALMDDNPGGFRARINGSYPERKTVSTVPATLLAVLPILPADIEYRFAGKNLVLLDTRSRLIIDRIPNAIRRPKSGAPTP